MLGGAGPWSCSSVQLCLHPRTWVLRPTADGVAAAASASAGSSSAVMMLASTSSIGPAGSASCPDTRRLSEVGVMSVVK